MFSSPRPLTFPVRFLCLAFCLFLPLTLARFALAAEPETLSATDARLVLNGLWRFQPAAGPAATSPDAANSAWGVIRVPGHWDCEGWDARWLEGILTPGTTGGWSAVTIETVSTSRPTRVVKKLDSAWYERALTIPTAWRGRQIVLRLETPCTDIRAWLDNIEVGTGAWPIAELDLTPHLRFDGKPATLRLLVTATPAARGISEAMDHDRITVTKGVVDHRGLAGDVMLLARPAARVDGVFIQPSVRQKTLGLDIDFTGVKPASQVALAITATRDGKTAATWNESVTVPAAGPDGRATVRGLRLPWADPVLWDFQQPELYSLSIRASAPGLDSEHRERFGFREFWIEGRDFYLNDTVVQFRPLLLDAQHTDPRLMRLSLEGLLKKNFNLAEYWPGPDSARGSKNLVLRHHWAPVADELGFPLILPILSPDAWFDPLDRAPKPAAFAAWQREAAELWRLTRNSPSVLVHNCVGNRFSHGDDQNPRRIGQRAALGNIAGRTEALAPAHRLMAALRDLDPTRPVMSHHAADVGDIHTSNNYLNVTPLQERQDWLSRWAKVGDMPFMAVEFGVPFSGTYNRGRANHTGQDISEPWLTEFIATYRGTAAYLDEDAPYRRMIAEEHKEGFIYRSARVTRSSQLAPFQAFWIRETWPAWRTWGVSGGMIPWENANGFERPANSVRYNPLPPPEGTLGGFRDNIPESHLGLAAPSLKTNVAGEALIDANAPLRVWIAGPRDDFTRKDHRFLPGESVAKSAVILNDTRAPVAWTISWRAILGDTVIASASATGQAAPGSSTFSPITFTAPTVFMPTDGRIEVTATFNGINKTDIFSFRVAPVPVVAAPPEAAPFIFDPEGASLALLRAAGLTPAALAPGAVPPVGASLVLGRNAVRDPAFTPEWAAALTNWVKSGGRLLLLAQDPDWLRERSGFRFARHVSRRAFPVATQRDHPLLSGLDVEDFRDWRGDGSLLAPEYQTALDRPEVKVAAFRPPTYGWRWGTRGSVASASLEKPHFSGWTPLLENEFDLAFTPLAELVLGQGYVLWCGLDLEARGTEEPLVRDLASRLVTRLTEVRPAPRRAVLYLGDDTGAARLAALDVPFTRITSAPPGPAADKLLVAGAPAIFDLKDWLARGGNAFFLPRDEGATFPSGLRAARAPWSLARTLPGWPEARGLGLGDLRLRVDQDAALFASAENVAADGALARIAEGDGVAILFQLDATALPADTKTYLRFSQWRLNRATSQLLANLGAQFARDADLLNFALPRGQPVTLGGEWRYQVEGELIPGAKSADSPVAEPANRGFALNWHRENFDDSSWAPITLPTYVPDLEKQDGVMWFRREFDLPSEFEGRPLNLALGPMDDFEDVYLNGVRVGGTPKGTPQNWALYRTFKLRPGTANVGRNVIAIRLWDHFGGGGFSAPATAPMRIELAKPLPRPTPYTPGYRDDYAQGDDYARYYRW